MVYAIHVFWQLWAGANAPAHKLSANLYDIALLCVQWRTPDDGRRNCPKHVEFHSKNKFEKLVHLVGFVIWHLGKVKEGELNGTKNNSLFYPNKLCDASVLGANYMDANTIIVAFIKVMIVFCVCLFKCVCVQLSSMRSTIRGGLQGALCVLATWLACTRLPSLAHYRCELRYHLVNVGTDVSCRNTQVSCLFSHFVS